MFRAWWPARPGEAAGKPGADRASRPHGNERRAANGSRKSQPAHPEVRGQLARRRAAGSTAARNGTTGAAGPGRRTDG